MKKTISADVNQTKLLAANFLKEVKLGQKVGLRGPLGAGKTTFIQGASNALGIGLVRSPTFVFHQPHLIKKGRFKGKFFHHFDFYRLSKAAKSDLKQFTKLFDKKSLIFIEWPENLPTLEKALDWLIDFKILRRNQREIIIKGKGERGK